VPSEGITAQGRAVGSEARRLLDAFGLTDWTFGFNRRKRSLGVCLYARRRIELSVHLVSRNGVAEVRDTLLHEIAHALVGPGHGHDAVWKARCVEIGARPERLAHEVDMPRGRWQAHCRTCGVLHHRHRRPRPLRGWFCRSCGPERGRLTWALLPGSAAG
jgi:predicted SprT family Zn-dependent metalloprotease